MANEEYLGCGDGGCVVERPKGMHTNGGCRCLMSLHPDERVRVRASFKRLRSALAKAEAERDDLAEHIATVNDDVWNGDRKKADDG